MKVLFIVIYWLCFGFLSFGGFVLANTDQGYNEQGITNSVVPESSHSIDRTITPPAPLPNKGIPDVKQSEKDKNNSIPQPNISFCEDGIKLNTNIPFVGRCIKKDPTGDGVHSGNVFARLMGSMTRIVMSVVVIIGFLAILVGGFMISAGGVKSDLMSKGKSLIIKVIAGLALVGISGIILNLINPNFFKTGGIIIIQKTFYR